MSKSGSFLPYTFCQSAAFPVSLDAALSSLSDGFQWHWNPSLIIIISTQTKLFHQTVFAFNPKDGDVEHMAKFCPNVAYPPPNNRNEHHIQCSLRNNKGNVCRRGKNTTILTSCVGPSWMANKQRLIKKICRKNHRQNWPAAGRVLRQSARLSDWTRVVWEATQQYRKYSDEYTFAVNKEKCKQATVFVTNSGHPAMDFVDFPCHTQSVERMVKVVTEASSSCIGKRKRDGAMRAKLKSRSVMPEFDHKSNWKTS